MKRLLILAACLFTSSGESKPSQPQLASGVWISGVWSSECSDDQISYQDTFHIDRTHREDRYFYADDDYDCSRGVLAHQIRKATYEIMGDRIIYTLVSVTFEASTPTTAQIFSSDPPMFGYTDWQANVPKDVAGLHQEVGDPRTVIMHVGEQWQQTFRFGDFGQRLFLSRGFLAEAIAPIYD